MLSAMTVTTMSSNKEVINATPRCLVGCRSILAHHVLAPAEFMTQ